MADFPNEIRGSRGNNTDIKEKLVKYLKTAGEFGVSVDPELAKKFGCSKQALTHSLKKLIEAGVVGGFRGSFCLYSKYMAGDSWRDVVKNVSNIQNKVNIAIAKDEKIKRLEKEIIVLRRETRYYKRQLLSISKLSKTILERRYN